ncbi:MAG: GDP-L-fucose synthase [Verrucomicrobiota bacterium]
MSKKIFIAGHRGLVGSALVRLFESLPDWEVIVRTRQELDLTDEKKTVEFLASEKPTHVIDAAAKVGGIKANNERPVDFLVDNIKIQMSLIQACHLANVEKLLFLGSSCIYPKFAEQPIREESLMAGPLELTNDGYAIAKISGIYMCRAYRRQYGRDYISAMPTNLFGPNDNYDINTSHVMPALIKKFHTAKIEGQTSVGLWGTGEPKREFLHSDDLAQACLVLLDKWSSEEIINIGTGKDISIRELAEQVKEVVGFEGSIEWDTSMPDGTPRKLLDVSRIHSLGWEPQISLRSGIESTYDYFKEHQAG